VLVCLGSRLQTNELFDSYFSRPQSANAQTNGSLPDLFSSRASPLVVQSSARTSPFSTPPPTQLSPKTLPVSMSAREHLHPTQPPPTISLPPNPPPRSNGRPPVLPNRIHLPCQPISFCYYAQWDRSKGRKERDSFPRFDWKFSFSLALAVDQSFFLSVSIIPTGDSKGMPTTLELSPLLLASTQSSTPNFLVTAPYFYLP